MYRYHYRTTAGDLWQLSMYSVYSSLAGVCNVIFTVSILALGIARWREFGMLGHILLVLAFLLFTVFQPALLYGRARRQAAGITGDTELLFDERGLCVRQDGKEQRLGWKQIRGVVKRPTLLLVLSDASHGYVLSDRVTGGEKKKLLAYISARCKAHSGTV